MLVLGSDEPNPEAFFSSKASRCFVQVKLEREGQLSTFP